MVFPHERPQTCRFASGPPEGAEGVKKTWERPGVFLRGKNHRLGKHHLQAQCATKDINHGN